MSTGWGERVAVAFTTAPPTQETVARTADPPGAPWWRRFSVWFPLLVYTVTRAVDAVYFAVMQRWQIPMVPGNGAARVIFPTPAAPGYFPVTANWDGQWYHEIAELGYPDPLPIDPDTGQVAQNPWAFYPAFPMLARGLMRLTGWNFYVAGSTLSLVVGAVAMVLLFRLVDRAAGRWSAIVATVATTTWVAAPVLQTAYSESCALLVIVLLLTALRGRRYGWVLVLLVVLALTRNLVLVSAPPLIVHALVRHLRRDTDPFPVRQRAALLGLTVLSVALTFLWPTICGLVTGDQDGYTKTMAGWGVDAFEIKLPTWLDYIDADYGWPGWLACLLAVGWFVRRMLSTDTARWGPELWGWAGAYPAYQVLVTGIGPSRIRYALLAFPVFLLLAWILNQPRLRRRRAWWLAAYAVVLVALQGWWVWNYWMITELPPDVQFP
ncbi:MAG: hypothetical protein IPL45_03305 [Actinomycetales bacterium]|nr:hypothetical protein [Actinomycetales bacterium]